MPISKSQTSHPGVRRCSLTLRELASVVFPDGHYESDLLVLLKTFIDDSADEKREQVVIAGAFVGRFGQWSELKRQWRKRLHREEIEYFRSSEYNSLTGQFYKYRDPVKLVLPSELCLS